MSLQKNRLRSAKNVIFSLLCILVDRLMGGGFEPPKPPLCVRPCEECTSFRQEQENLDYKFNVGPIR